MNENEKPEVQLTGKDGNANAFAIMGACRKAWQRAGNNMNEWKAIQEKMMNGDYNHLLCVAMEHFEVV